MQTVKIDMATNVGWLAFTEFTCANRKYAVCGVSMLWTKIAFDGVHTAICVCACECKKCNGTLKMVKKYYWFFQCGTYTTLNDLNRANLHGRQYHISSAIFFPATTTNTFVHLCNFLSFTLSVQLDRFVTLIQTWAKEKKSVFFHEERRVCDLNVWCVTCCPVADVIELWLSIFSDRRLATSFTSCAKLLLTTSEPNSNAPVKRFNAPVSLPSTSLNSLSPFSNCFHAINDVVSESKRFFTLMGRKIQNKMIKRN